MEIQGQLGAPERRLIMDAFNGAGQKPIVTIKAGSLRLGRISRALPDGQNKN